MYNGQNDDLNRQGKCLKSLIIKKFLDNREPMLYVDVNLGQSGSQRIVVFEGDKAEELAANFAARFGLDAGMQEKLATMLQQQISGVLEKIDEEVASSSNNSGLMEWVLYISLHKCKLTAKEVSCLRLNHFKIKHITLS